MYACTQQDRANPKFGGLLLDTSTQRISEHACMRGVKEVLFRKCKLSLD